MKDSKIFIAYIDDNGQPTTAYVDIEEMAVSYVKFKTDNNIITIPWSRILKIKERGENNNE